MSRWGFRCGVFGRTVEWYNTTQTFTRFPIFPTQSGLFCNNCIKPLSVCVSKTCLGLVKSAFSQTVNRVLPWGNNVSRAIARPSYYKAKAPWNNWNKTEKQTNQPFITSFKSTTDQGYMWQLDLCWHSLEMSHIPYPVSSPCGSDKGRPLRVSFLSNTLCTMA